MLGIHTNSSVYAEKGIPVSRAKTKVYRVVRTNLNAQVYDILKEMIADRRFMPGSSLNVESLTKELGVSRTPIWEAVRRLEQEGIVFHTPHKGVRVIELTRKMALDLYEVRETMEAMAARLGAERATPEIIARMGKILSEQKLVVKREDDVAYSRSDHDFHLLIYEACGNDLLKEILEGLRYKALPLAFKLSPHYAEFLEFHQQILEAFQNRDTRAAEKTMQRHHHHMLEIIRKAPWGFDGEKEIR
jgi:DNA-binding GntR family transcriptional regulator